ncbi:DUF983 domain-containing protein [Pararhodobacter zhoushanensis]|uniref:DUF983 domain-containing protein n=1 Tax=Pararhodobacter zhoushanensis TaxID=2479545 RepID=A0ABT3GYI1_9RHOB|nr:DUF983 domain-containing protein [Pararhodobacter zhoushanensis]MCW1932548.1 DUF983 domain-containing protein [Pararhodobacter zhoushanensis]
MTMIAQPIEMVDDRPLKPALRKGWSGRCPACGTGKIMRGYLKVVDECPNCGEDLHHQRADDGPAYLTILVVGKSIMALYLAVYLAWGPSPWVMITLCWTLALALALYLLPRFKGALVALQWSRRMHGFGSDA